MAIRDCLVGGWQAAEICGCSYRQIDYWVRSGLIPRPEVPANGPGSRRGFSLRDLVRARLIVELKKRGLPADTLRRAMDALTDKWREMERLPGRQLMIVGDQLLWDLSGEQLLNVIAAQDKVTTLVVLPIGEIVEDTRRRAIQACETEYVA